MVGDQEFFRFESVKKNGVYIGTAIGTIGKCRGCGRLVKSCVLIKASGAVQETIIQLGETKKTKGGEISFTQKEADEYKAKAEKAKAEKEKLVHKQA
jgi:hypothetical protein